MIMERRAIILQHPPSVLEVQGIIACKDKAWRRGRDYYPYAPFGKPESWKIDGELGRAIAEKNLHVAVVKNDKGEPVGHAAGVSNKFGLEIGRVFTSIEGQKLGIQAVDRLRQHIEQLGYEEIHMGVSYNRTAMWRAFEESFSANGWQIAILGLLPDIYSEGEGNEHMQWGEIISRAVKGKNMELPNISSNMPPAFHKFALGIQKLNENCMQFIDESKEMEPLLPYQFNENIFALGWNDYQNQKLYLNSGYNPVGLVKLNDQWCFVVYKGDLPQRAEGKGFDLQLGRNPVIYPAMVDGLNLSNVIKFIYQE